MTTESLLRATVAVGRELAAELRLPVRLAFADGLAGDVMRFRVLRRLRKKFPSAESHVLNAAIEELLTP